MASDVSHMDALAVIDRSYAFELVTGVKRVRVTLVPGRMRHPGTHGVISCRTLVSMVEPQARSRTHYIVERLVLWQIARSQPYMLGWHPCLQVHT
jgi:hypothetical protein